MAGSDNLYIFLDEGGNLDFSSTGTRFFTLTSVTMIRPFLLAEPLDNLKYDLIDFGLNLEFFHASEDKQEVRNRVFNIIQSHIKNIEIDSLIVEKPKTGPSLRALNQFYPRMLSYLLRHPVHQRSIFNKGRADEFDEIIIVTDTLPMKRQRKIIEKSVKTNLKDLIPETPYRIMHHSSKSSMELQIADYCNWAIFRKWERGDSRAYEIIKEGIRSEFEIFRTGNRHYY